VSVGRQVVQWAVVLGVLSVSIWLAPGAVHTLLADQAATTAQAPTQTVARRCELLDRARTQRPDLAEYWRLEAECQADSDPDAALALAQTSTRIDPRGSANWVSLAMIEIQLDHLAAARQALREAERYNVGFDAHFHAAGLALTEGSTQDFWREMKLALSMVPLPELNAVLAECLRAAGNDPSWPSQVLPPDRADVVAAAIFYFLTQNRLPEAEQAWQRLNCPVYDQGTCQHAIQNLAAVLVQTAMRSRESEAQRLTDLAVQVWNRGLQQTQSSLPKAQAGKIADGEFAQEWAGASFDWRALGQVRLQRLQEGPSGNWAVRLHFDGSQGEEQELFREYVPVTPGKTYQLGYSARRDGSGTAGGVELVAIGHDQKDLAVLPARLGSAWQDVSMQFTIPRGEPLIALLYRYHRPFGELLLRDDVLLAQVHLQEVH
jgi:hypothetical protein